MTEDREQARRQLTNESMEQLERSPLGPNAGSTFPAIETALRQRWWQRLLGIKPQPDIRQLRADGSVETIRAPWWRRPKGARRWARRSR